MTSSVVDGETTHSVANPALYWIVFFTTLFVGTWYFWGSIDPIAQTVLVITLLIAIVLHQNVLSIFLNQDGILTILWMALLTSILISLKFSYEPERSRQSVWIWVNCLLVYGLASGLRVETKVRIICALELFWAALCAISLYNAFRTHIPPTGRLLNPNGLAGALVLPFFLTLDNFFQHARERSKHLVVLLLIFTTILACRSLGAFVAIGLGNIWIFFSAEKRRNYTGVYYGLATLCILAAIGSLLWQVTTHWDSHRWQWWSACIEMFKTHPFFGLGPGIFEIALAHTNELGRYSLYAHNSWLQWLAENGLFFMISLVALMTRCFRSQTSCYVKAGVVAVCAHNLVDYSFLIPSVLFLLWFVLAPASQEQETRHSDVKRRAPHKAISFWIAIACASISLQAWNDFQKDRAAKLIGQETISITDDIIVLTDPRATAALENSQTWYWLAKQALLSGSPSAPYQSVAYLHGAISRSPLPLVYWTSILKLVDTLGWHERSALYRNEILSKFPFYRNDKRLSVQ